MLSKYLECSLFPDQTSSVSNQKFSRTREKAIVCFSLNAHTYSIGKKLIFPFDLCTQSHRWPSGPLASNSSTAHCAVKQSPATVTDPMGHGRWTPALLSQGRFHA